ncbi:MAG: hypothetical protein AVDCRST_MAG89-5342, partial [uncultured Gemmatimonadetes bacterium]
EVRHDRRRADDPSGDRRPGRRLHLGQPVPGVRGVLQHCPELAALFGGGPHDEGQGHVGPGAL